jgi:hypothetical protein
MGDRSPLGRPSGSRQGQPAGGSCWFGRRLRRRLHCAARPGRARHNSLRGLRPLRSDTCRESEGEARPAVAPRPLLRCSPTQKSPPAGSPWRDGTGGGVPVEHHRRCRKGPCGRLAARMERRAPLGSWPRAQRASTSYSPHVSERSERSSRSELCGGPRDRGGEPGREQSGGLFSPGERPDRKGRRGLQGQGSLRRRRRPRNLSAAGRPHGPLPAPTHEHGEPTVIDRSGPEAKTRPTAVRVNRGPRRCARLRARSAPARSRG